jgi:hypothetical protein
LLDDRPDGRWVRALGHRAEQESRNPRREAQLLDQCRRRLGQNACSLLGGLRAHVRDLDGPGDRERQLHRRTRLGLQPRRRLLGYHGPGARTAFLGWKRLGRDCESHRAQQDGGSGRRAAANVRNVDTHRNGDGQRDACPLWDSAARRGRRCENGAPRQGTLLLDAGAVQDGEAQALEQRLRLALRFPDDLGYDDGRRDGDNERHRRPLVDDCPHFGALLEDVAGRILFGLTVGDAPDAEIARAERLPGGVQRPSDEGGNRHVRPGDEDEPEATLQPLRLATVDGRPGCSDDQEACACPVGGRAAEQARFEDACGPFADLEARGRVDCVRGCVVCEVPRSERLSVRLRHKLARRFGRRVAACAEGDVGDPGQP